MNRLHYYFASCGFADLLPLAMKIAGELDSNPAEMIEAICKVADKAKTYPPTRNRSAWFAAVFREKLLEVRAEVMAWRKNRWYSLP